MKKLLIILAVLTGTFIYAEEIKELSVDQKISAKEKEIKTLQDECKQRAFFLEHWKNIGTTIKEMPEYYNKIQATGEKLKEEAHSLLNKQKNIVDLEDRYKKEKNGNEKASIQKKIITFKAEYNDIKTTWEKRKIEYKKMIDAYQKAMEERQAEAKKVLDKAISELTELKKTAENKTASN